MAEMQDMMMKVIRTTTSTRSEKAKRARKEVGKEEERAAKAKVKAMENVGTAGKKVIEQLTVPRKEEEKEGNHLHQVSSEKEEEKGFPGECWNCGGFGHGWRECTSQKGRDAGAVGGEEAQAVQAKPETGSIVDQRPVKGEFWVV